MYMCIFYFFIYCYSDFYTKKRKRSFFFSDPLHKQMQIAQVPTINISRLFISVINLLAREKKINNNPCYFAYYISLLKKNVKKFVYLSPTQFNSRNICLENNCNCQREIKHSMFFLIYCHQNICGTKKILDYD